ncbi:MAG: peptidoglycan DD-metalloendopeptidase family protein [Amphiplicatus sp.]
MRGMSSFIIGASAAALAACGTHESVRRAAVAPAAPYDPPTVYQAPAPKAPKAAPVAPVSTDFSRGELAPVAKSAPTYISMNGAAAPSASGNLVTVRPGDTVFAIARRAGVRPDAIIAENGLRPPYTLKVGDTLRAPDPERKIENRLTEPAPIRAVVASDRLHKVRPGDTLYSISRSSGVGVEKIATANRLRPPYPLKVGDEILVPGARGETAGPVRREVTAPREDVAEIARAISYAEPKPAAPRLFDWPVKGAVIGDYGAGAMGRRNDGVNIAAPVGTPVRAAADGEVVYRGSELDGYGNLLLVKHQDGFVTAYAHNDAMLVKKGDLVRQGQVIAKVGQTGAATEPQLHFEIRQNLKSVDPMEFLQD